MIFLKIHINCFFPENDFKSTNIDWLNKHSLLCIYHMNIRAINNGQNLHFSVSRQLYSISECWEDLCLGKSPCRCTAADCLLSSNAAPQTSESSLLTFHSFSLSQLYALNFRSAPHPIRIQLLKSHISPLWLQETDPSAIKPRVWSAQLFPQIVFAFWVLGIWSFSSSANTLTMTHCSAARPIAALCRVKPKCSVYIGSSVRQAHGGTNQLLSIAWLPSGK